MANIDPSILTKNAKRSAQRRERYHANKEKSLTAARAYRYKNADKIKKYMHEYNIVNNESSAKLKKEYYSKHKARLKKLQLKHESDPTKRPIEMVNKSRNRAAKNNVEFNADAVRTASESATKNCPCCGVEFNYNRNRGWAGRRYSPSMDRVDNEKGYITGNLAVICWRCNAIKRDATSSELRLIADWIDSFLKAHRPCTAKGS